MPGIGGIGLIGDGELVGLGGNAGGIEPHEERIVLECGVAPSHGLGPGPKLLILGGRRSSRESCHDEGQDGRRPPSWARGPHSHRCAHEKSSSSNRGSLSTYLPRTAVPFGESHLPCGADQDGSVLKATGPDGNDDSGGEGAVNEWTDPGRHEILHSRNM